MLLLLPFFSDFLFVTPSSKEWHPPWYRLDTMSPGLVLMAVVASICQRDLSVPTLHDPLTKARSLDGVARAPLRMGLKPCVLPVALLS